MAQWRQRENAEELHRDLESARLELIGRFRASAANEVDCDVYQRPEPLDVTAGGLRGDRGSHLVPCDLDCCETGTFEPGYHLPASALEGQQQQQGNSREQHAGADEVVEGTHRGLLLGYGR